MIYFLSFFVYSYIFRFLLNSPRVILIASSRSSDPPRIHDEQLFQNFHWGAEIEIAVLMKYLSVYSSTAYFVNIIICTCKTASPLQRESSRQAWLESLVNGIHILRNIVILTRSDHSPRGTYSQQLRWLVFPPRPLRDLSSTFHVADLLIIYQK